LSPHLEKFSIGALFGDFNFFYCRFTWSSIDALLGDFHFFMVELCGLDTLESFLFDAFFGDFHFLW
jgi:hypothetical protein